MFMLFFSFLRVLCPASVPWDWCMFRDVCADGPVSVLHYDTSYATPHNMRFLKFAVVMELRYHPM